MFVNLLLKQTLKQPNFGKWPHFCLVFLPAEDVWRDEVLPAGRRGFSLRWRAGGSSSELPPLVQGKA